MWVDEYIPNFTLFIFYILPTLIVILIVTIAIEKWINRSKKTKKEQSFISWIMAIYLIVPVFRVVEYLRGVTDLEELAEGLFVVDFTNFMILGLVAGIINVIFILRERTVDLKSSKKESGN